MGADIMPLRFVHTRGALKEQFARWAKVCKSMEHYLQINNLSRPASYDENDLDTGIVSNAFFTCLPRLQKLHEMALVLAATKKAQKLGRAVLARPVSSRNTEKLTAQTIGRDLSSLKLKSNPHLFDQVGNGDADAGAVIAAANAAKAAKIEKRKHVRKLRERARRAALKAAKIAAADTAAAATVALTVIASGTL